MEKPPVQLDYAHKPTNPAPPRSTGSRIIGFIGGVLYLVLSLPFLRVTIMAITRGHSGRIDHEVVTILLGTFFLWRAIMGFYQAFSNRPSRWEQDS